MTMKINKAENILSSVETRMNKWIENPSEEDGNAK